MTITQVKKVLERTFTGMSKEDLSESLLEVTKILTDLVKKHPGILTVGFVMEIVNATRQRLGKAYTAEKFIVTFDNIVTISINSRQ
jgi:hypothetical protein